MAKTVPATPNAHGEDKNASKHCMPSFFETISQSALQSSIIFFLLLSSDTQFIKEQRNDFVSSIDWREFE